MLRDLFRYFKPHRKIFALDMFCAIMIAFIDGDVRSASAE